LGGENNNKNAEKGEARRLYNKIGSQLSDKTVTNTLRYGRANSLILSNLQLDSKIE